MNMAIEFWTYAAAALALVGLMAYAVLGGADFGGGVWDLFATGRRKDAQREAIARAMGPVWEANHVWLIFVVVVLFTAFPYGYAPLGMALFVPFHLALVGIMLRGASFVFRGYVAGSGGAKDPAAMWGVVFGVASVITPVLLGAAFGVVTEGNLRISGGQVRSTQALPWLGLYPMACGLLALSTCAYLAAVYLCAETDGALRDDFHRRAIVAGTTTAALAFAVFGLAWYQAEWFVRALLGWWPVLAVGLVFFALSAWAVFGRRYLLARVFAAGEIIVLLLGWGLAQQPYLVYPSLTLHDAAGPVTTIRFLVLSVPVGMIVLIPALWYLFKVFKMRPATQT
jgi:cytochrome bd ubiquinol oxidase subunit II